MNNTTTSAANETLIPGGHACPTRGCWVHQSLERCPHCKPALKSYYLQLETGAWVSSPTHTSTKVPALRACFGGKYGSESDQDVEGTVARLEAIHGKLTVVNR